MKNTIIKNLRLNKVIRHFILSDLLFFAGWGLVGPILAIFIFDRIIGADLIVIGTTTAIYWLTKSLFQVPVAIFLDKKKGEKDDFYVLIAGLTLAGLAAISFILAKTVPALYSAIFIQGLAFGLYTPAWSAIFSRHLDSENCSLNWSLDSTAIGLGSGIAAFAGGYVANIWGFEAVFMATGVLSFVSAFVLLSLPKLILPKPVSTEQIMRDHTPVNIGK